MSAKRARGPAQAQAVSNQMPAQGASTSRFNIMNAQSNAQQLSTAFSQEHQPTQVQSQQHKFEEKKYTHSPTSRSRLKNMTVPTSGAAAENEEINN